MNALICLSLLGYCFALTRFSKWPIAFSPFFIISCVITLLYFFAYIHCLKAGTDGIFFSGLILLILSPSYLKNKLFEKYFTPSLIISILFLTIFLTLAYHQCFSKWDEFTQWGPHSKLLFLTNRLITQSDFTIHQSYPPGGALFQYLFFTFSHYAEGTAYVAQCLLILAPFSIFISQCNWKNWEQALIIYALILLILLILHIQVGVNNSLYMDAPVAIFFGMSIVAYLNSQKNISHILYLIPMMAALVLFKQKLMPFVLLISLIILVDQIVFYKKKNIVFRIISVSFLPITAYIITESWHIYLFKMHIPIEWKMNFLISHSTAKIIAENYLLALKPVFLFIALMIALNLVSYVLEKNKTEKQKIIIVNSILCIGMIAYITGLLMLYLFAFDPHEAIRHASMHRYMRIDEVAWVLVSLYFLFQATHQLRLIKYKILCIIFLIFSYFLLFSLALRHQNKNIHHTRQAIAQIAKAVKKIASKNTKIFIVWQDSTGFERAILMYDLIPLTTNSGCTSFGKPYVKADIWTCFVSPKVLLQKFSGYQYVLLAYTDHNFWKQYQSVLPHKNKLNPLISYSICKRKNFNTFGQVGCQIKIEKAYLLKM